MNGNWLEISGAGEHNLKDVDLAIPKNRLVVFTGVSGSGKSSLAFDTIYVEGQRKYIESLSSYARQFLGQLERPRYGRMSGLSPTVAIEQKTASSNPRSTVGTVTEILDYMRVLFARAGDQRCHGCGRQVGKQDAQQVVRALCGLPAGTTATLLAPLVRQRKGEFRQTFEEMMGLGFVRFRIDGEVVRLEKAPVLDKKRKHDIDIVVDRVRIDSERVARLTDSVELTLKAGGGRLIADLGDRELTFSEHLYCDRCELSLPELTPQLFSFNNPLGACPTCAGLGSSVDLDAQRLFTPPTQSIFKALRRVTYVWIGRRRGWEYQFFHGLRDRLGLTPGTQVADLEPAMRDRIVHGDGQEGGFPGLWSYVERDLATTSSEAVRSHYPRCFSESPCRSCSGTRLRPEAAAVLVSGRSVVELAAASVEELSRFFSSLVLDGHKDVIAAEPRREILARLKFLEDVGLEYLTLDRPAHTLSGGEAQRIRLARQLGSELAGVIYILDPPSVGLHQRDGLRLVKTLERLRDLGNTVIVVEHDRETMAHADWVVDFGPGAGRDGGRVVYSGEMAGLVAHPDSITGAYLSGRERIEVPDTRAAATGHLALRGIRLHNLDGLDVSIPLGVFTVVTGVSGAGKSSLVTETLRPLLENLLHGSRERFEGTIDAIEGTDAIDRVITIDQRPIGRTPRSNPSTYTKVFDVIRRLFAGTRDARTFGYDPGRFSFNVKGGRCEKCNGDGSLKIEMHFLPDVYIRCPECQGKRFNEATLRVKYKDRDISQVLAMTVAEALEFFSQVPAARRILSTMAAVGLDYVALGQPSTTLSGGEAQRIKLSRELARSQSGRALFILDEPTTGLHFHDIRKLLAVLYRLRDAGHTIIMVEHNIDVIRCADWVIDLGPEGGAKGGKIVVAGPPERVAACPASHTARFLSPRATAPTARPRRNRR
ncbi:MAG: excinuclease ABC subunit UvrA [Deltaproteobacteria bacterium]|nr:excinuclease ABC subunit UvrA [Deltaproteobacteria bacterium]